MADIYAPYIGPSSKPDVVAHAHTYMTQTRCVILNISSILPDTMMEGTADMNPATNRPVTAPATVGVTPVMTHDIQYIKDEEI